MEERFISVRQVHQMSGLWPRQEGSMAEESFAVVIYLPANPKATSDEPVGSPHCSSDIDNMVKNVESGVGLVEIESLFPTFLAVRPQVNF